MSTDDITSFEACTQPQVLFSTVPSYYTRVYSTVGNESTLHSSTSGYSAQSLWWTSQNSFRHREKPLVALLSRLKLHCTSWSWDEPSLKVQRDYKIWVRIFCFPVKLHTTCINWTCEIYIKFNKFFHICSVWTKLNTSLHHTSNPENGYCYVDGSRTSSTGSLIHLNSVHDRC